MDPNAPTENEDDESLETPPSPGEAAGKDQAGGNLDESTVDATSDTPDNYVKPPTPPPPGNFFQRLIRRFNIYILMMLVLLMGAAGVVIFAYLTSKHQSGTTNLSSGSLSQNALQQLANSDATVGNANQVLNVESSAVFAGKVLLRQDLEVAGNLEVGGTLTLNDISVAGTAQIGQLEVNQNISVTGDANIQGAVTISKSLQVNGSGNFSGPITSPQITTSNLQLNSDLVITHHISAGGATPSISNGIALSGGGTASVSGSDTSGSITINTGVSPVAGCFMTLNFTTAYNAIPHVLITPIGFSAGGLAYYVNRSTASFSICDATTPPSNVSFGFDYWVVD